MGSSRKDVLVTHVSVSSIGRSLREAIHHTGMLSKRDVPQLVEPLYILGHLHVAGLLDFKVLKAPVIVFGYND